MDKTLSLPGVDSEGAAIAATKAGLSAFWDWFDDSVEGVAKINKSAYSTP